MECTLENYTDYLLAATKAATATEMSQVYEQKISHDKVTRFLSESYFDEHTVWDKAKPLVRKYQSPEHGVLIIDDSILEKPHTDDNAMVCWHYDHSKGRNVKGVNSLSLIYNTEQLSVPVDVRLIEKTEAIVDVKTGKTRDKSPVSKNELMRQMLLKVSRQSMQYGYILGDCWFSSSENMNFINDKIQKKYIMAIECSRTVALSLEDKLQGRFHRIDSLGWPKDGSPLRVYLRSVKHTVELVKQVFINKDQSQGVLYLVSNEVDIDAETIKTIYKRRWKVEEYHKSLKQHTSLGKSPTKTIKTQANHIYASIIAFIKLEKIKTKMGMNHFAIKSILITVASKAAFMALRQMLA